MSFPHLLSTEERKHRKQVKFIVTLAVIGASLSALLPTDWAHHALTANILANMLWIWLD